MNEPKLAEWNDRLRRAAEILDVSVRDLADAIACKHLNEGMEERIAVETNGCSWQEFVDWESAVAAASDPTDNWRAVRILVPAEEGE